MSIFTPGDNRRLSVARFSRIPGFQNLPAIEPLPSSAGGSVASSSESQTSTLIARDEPCLITKSISYTHERAHWISAVRGNNSLKAEVVGTSLSCNHRFQHFFPKGTFYCSTRYN